MILTTTVVLVLSLAATSTGFVVFSAGTCPDVEVKKNFNITAYQGPWYSYENFDAPYQFGMSCVTATYNLWPDMSIEVVNEGYREIRVFGLSLYRRDVRADGRARVVDWSDPAKLYVSFGGQPDFSLGNGPRANYMIVDTDYTSYSLVYSCSSLLVPFKLEGAWILTRVRGARPKNIFELENKLAAYGIEIKNFKMVDHENC